MRTRVFRISEQAIKDVEAFKLLYGIKKDRDALERLITESWHTHLYLQYVLTHRDVTKEQPLCLRRLLYLGKYFCAKHAPRITELPTLDICKACKWQVVVWNKRADKDLQDNKKPIKEVYCAATGGVYVVKEVCERCNEPCEKKALFDEEPSRS